jgi:hypothetical protein
MKIEEAWAAAGGGSAVVDLDSLVTSIEAAVGDVSKSGQTLRDELAAILEAGGPEAAALTGLDELLVDIREVGKEAGVVGEQIATLQRAVVETLLAELRGTTPEALRELDDQLKAVQDSITEDLANEAETRKRIVEEEYAHRLAVADAALEKGRLNEEEWTALIERAREARDRTLTEGQDRVVSEIQSGADDIGSAWASTMTRMVFDAERSFQEILAAFAQMIAEMTLRRALAGIADVAIGAVFDAVGESFSFGGGGTPGTGAGASAPVSDLEQGFSFSPSISRRARCWREWIGSRSPLRVSRSLT